jgi:predicted NBD/HSP70 family sugar kinase
MQSLRKNEIKVLHSIFSLGQSTRQRIARRTRLSLVKVSSILSLLQKGGFILKASSANTRSGRPSHLFRLKPKLGCALGLAVGLDRFNVIAMDAGKDITFRRELPLSLSADLSANAQAIIDQLSQELLRVVEKDLKGSGPILTLGVALPGLVDPRTGTWLLGLWLPGIANVSVAGLLAERLGIPVFVEDIARSVAFYELHRGSGRRVRSFVLIYLGSGVGSGIVINRRIYRGLHGLAGEIGHIEHADNAYRCSCNNVGCLETVISTVGMQRMFKDRLAQGVISSLQADASALDLERILLAAREGDRFTKSTLREIGHFLGDACAILIKMFNPERVIISGRGSMFRDFLKDSVEEVIHHGVIPEMLAGYRTVFAEYDPFQEAHGAALVAANHYFDRTLRGMVFPQGNVREAEALGMRGEIFSEGQ